MPKIYPTEDSLVCDRGLTSGDLIGVLMLPTKQRRMRLCIYRMSKLRFKPAYNPYTEPSMEISGTFEQNIISKKTPINLKKLTLKILCLLLFISYHEN
ncbi:hypothetical protein YC2023_078452 [Brassica napus]